MIVGAVAVWLGGWALNVWLARIGGWAGRWLPPLVFGLTLLLLWELVVCGSGCRRFCCRRRARWRCGWRRTGPRSGPTCARPSCGSAVRLCDRLRRRLPGRNRGRPGTVPRRGLLPVGNFASALPIIGMAPIMVMWFGFDWQSKAAVVVLMVFFPMLVNTVQGLAAADHMQRDLMRTYAASPARRS